MSFASYAGWSAYDTFLIMSLLGRPVYDPNPLRSNPNPKKSVSGSCHVRKLDWTLTALITTYLIVRQIFFTIENKNQEYKFLDGLHWLEIYGANKQLFSFLFFILFYTK